MSRVPSKVFRNNNQIHPQFRYNMDIAHWTREYNVHQLSSVFVLGLHIPSANEKCDESKIEPFRSDLMEHLNGIAQAVCARIAGKQLNPHRTLTYIAFIIPNNWLAMKRDIFLSPKPCGNDCSIGGGLPWRGVARGIATRSFSYIVIVLVWV